MDPKFLMKRDEAVPVRRPVHSTSTPLSQPASHSTPLTTASRPTHPATQLTSSRPLTSHLVTSGPVRLNQEMIIPRAQPPLASAYFPKS